MARTRRLIRRLAACSWTCGVCGNTYSNDQSCPYCP
jgi:rubrerythrin